ncbi:MAG: hypothetical protein ACYDAC_05675 [Candidatus Dormibacteria bacterium]
MPPLLRDMLATVQVRGKVGGVGCSQRMLNAGVHLQHRFEPLVGSAAPAADRGESLDVAADLTFMDRMVQAGRLTEREAEALRTAADASEFNHAVREIRARHAGVKLDEAVADGSMTRSEADNLLDRLRQGEHGVGIRSRLRSLRAHGRRDHG